MRIIGGEFGGRILKPKMKNWPTRPTTDVAKEALFNILQNRIDFSTTKMLDLFGGTGGHSFEFISRGCPDVTFVDMHKDCIEFVRNQSLLFKCESRIRVIKMNVKNFMESSTSKFDYIFAGPPYGLPWLGEIPNMMFDNKMLEEEGILIMEHNPNFDFTNHPNFTEKRNYGQTIFSFFAN